MDLRRAPQRVGVLHEMFAVAMRREDLASREEPAEVPRRRDLARVRAQRVEPLVERPVGAERGLDRHGGGHVGGLGQG